MAHGPPILRLVSAIVPCEAIAATGRLARNAPRNLPKARAQKGRCRGA
jgi:hypothetical protein